MSFLSKFFNRKTRQDQDKKPKAPPPRPVRLPHVSPSTSGNIHPPGARIAGRYEVAGRPLMGGMGIVYLCFDHQEQRPVALKTFRPEFLPDRAARDRFLREGTTWVNLGRHPHIVRAYGVEYVDVREIYLVLELVAKEEGRADASLRSWLTPGRPLSVKQALLFSLQIARGMAHATATIPGFVHRDLKPENVLVGTDRLTNANINRLRVTDFGLAAVLQEASQRIGKAAFSGQSPALSPVEGSAVSGPLGRTQLTRGIVGTPLYMAPEQWKGEAVTVQTDMYALGCILYEMLVGRWAVEGPSLAALERAHCRGEVQSLPPGLPGAVGEVVARCLALEPGARYAGWKEVEEALAAAYAGATGRAALGPEPVQMLDRAERAAMGWSYSRMGFSYQDIGKAEVALEYFERAREIGQAEGERHLEMVGLGDLGLAYAYLGDARRAIGCYEQALAIAREIGDRSGEGNTSNRLGLAYARLGEARRAIGYYEQSLAIACEIGDRSGEGYTLGNLGSAYLNLGDVQRAIECYEQSLEILREVGDQHGEEAILGNLGVIYAELGDVQRAIEFHEQSLAIARETGNRRGEGKTLGNLGDAYYRLGDARRAIRFYEQQLAITREIGDRRGEGNALTGIGLAYTALGDVQRAIGHYEQALATAREIGDRRGEGAALGNLGIAHKKLGDAQRAIGYCEQHLEIAREIGDRRGEGAALGNLGDAYRRLGDAQRAIGFHEQALVIRRETGDMDGAATDSFRMALLHLQQGERERALSLAQQAAEIWGQIGSPSAHEAQQLVAAIRMVHW